MKRQSTFSELLRRAQGLLNAMCCVTGERQKVRLWHCLKCQKRAHMSMQPVSAQLSGGTNIAVIIQSFDLMPHDRREKSCVSVFYWSINGNLQLLSIKSLSSMMWPSRGLCP